MGELRKDYILDQWVIIAAKRGKRPHEYKEKPYTEIVTKDFFGCGHEDLTPQEIGHKGKTASCPWKMRWFDNKFAAVQPEGEPHPTTEGFFTWANNYGHHEILVETPDSKQQLWDMSADEINDVLETYNEIVNKLLQKPSIKYVNLFKNSGPKAGTSIVHSHTQIIATSILPPRVQEEVAAVRRFTENPYEKIIEIEKQGVRRVFENSTAVAFCPYASRFNFEVWVFPKKFARNLGEVESVKDVAEALQKVLARLKELNCSYNILYHYSPEGADLHMHFEVIPRIAIWAGFELGSGIIINSVPPEQAAAFYRGES